jgi:putative transposase
MPLSHLHRNLLEIEVLRRPLESALSSTTAKLMVLKLIMAISKTWRRLNGEKQLPKVTEGVRFIDGIEIIETPSQNYA